MEGDVQAQMQEVGKLPTGGTLYYADECFTEPGFYVGDPDAVPVNQRVEIIPADRTRTRELDRAAICEGIKAWLLANPGRPVTSEEEAADFAAAVEQALYDSWSD